MFEFDAKKSKANKAKHGIDFVEAQKLWEDQSSVVMPSGYKAEERLILTAKLDEKLWSMIFTRRKEKIRIISVRRARENEKEEYYNS